MKPIFLTKGFIAYVSDEDYERVNAHKWCVSHESRGTKWYAVRMQNRKKIRMHHFVLGITWDDIKPKVVHHIDDDGLNNTRENLEIITQRENMLFSPGWKRKCNKRQSDKRKNSKNLTSTSTKTSPRKKRRNF